MCDVPLTHPQVLVRIGMLLPRCHRAIVVVGYSYGISAPFELCFC
jgi:hypothetical protein